MKRLTHQLRYDGASVAQVFEMLGTPQFREEVCSFQGFPRREVTIERAGEGMTVVVDQHRPADEVPSFAKRFVGPEINIVQEEHWSSPADARLTVTIPGKPGRMTGTIALAEEDGGVTESVAVDITVKLPLVAGKVEDLISGMLLKALKAENRVGREWLAGEH